ncbi:MAG: xylan 1,4-beta-xylosidase [Oscillospiraceae bacterium]|nr:xylan 1,4-beta-xylosidase [Oscillospiraceae bacterium]
MANKKDDRFIKVYSQSGGFAGNNMVIYVDKETGVNYLFSCSGYAGGLTPLLNRDGTPVVTPLPKTYEE